MIVSRTYGCCTCSSCGLRWRCYWWRRCNGHLLGDCDREGQRIGCWLYGDRLGAIFGRAKLHGREITGLTLEKVWCKNGKTKEDRIHCDHDDGAEVLRSLLLIRRALQSMGHERRWRWPLYRPRVPWAKLLVSTYGLALNYHWKTKKRQRRPRYLDLSLLYTLL